jgi:hypothetical protein
MVSAGKNRTKQRQIGAGKISGIIKSIRAGEVLSENPALNLFV